MWFNRPAYNTYAPYGYGYSSFEDPNARAIAREHAARERHAATRRADLLRLQQMQDAARSPYNSYLSDDDDDDYNSFVSYPYNPRAHDYAAPEDLERRQILERQRQLELAHHAELNGRREAERVTEHGSKEQKPTSTSTPNFSVPISSSGGSPSESSHTKPTHLPKYPSPPLSPKPVTPEATPERIRAAMTIQEFYRNRTARRQALTSIAELSAKFEQLKSAFSPPSRLDYCGATPGDIVTIPVSPESFVHASSIPPSENAEDTAETSKSSFKLPFTSNNKVVLEYTENLNQLVDKLDRIESGGHASVREQRKQMIRNVEAEAQRMDRWIAAVWKLAQPQVRTRPEPQPNRRLQARPTMEDVFAEI